MKRLQLEDLSRELGYSKTLISMVLNGKGNQYGISKKTQAAVLDAVAQLDYSPNVRQCGFLQQSAFCKNTDRIY
jgi:LacI family transcriptional regulator